MIIREDKFGVDRIPVNKEAILHHREMPLIDVLVENSMYHYYTDISYQYDVGLVAKHVNRPLVELVGKDKHPRPTCYETERECAQAMEEHAKLWAVPDRYTDTSEIVGLVNVGAQLTLMRGMVPQPIARISTFGTYTPDCESRIVYVVRVKEHEKFGLKDAFDSQHVYYTPTNILKNIKLSDKKMVAVSHSVLSIAQFYRESLNRLDKYFPDVNPTDYADVVAIDISDMPTGFLSDHPADIEYYVGNTGWLRFINVETLMDYIEKHPECVTPLNFNAKEGIKADLDGNDVRKFSDMRIDDDFSDLCGDKPNGADGVEPCEAEISVEYLVDDVEAAFKGRLIPYRAVVKFKVEDYSFIPPVLDLASVINHNILRLAIRKVHGDNSLYFVESPLLDNFTSDGFVKATKNELVYYGVIVNNHGLPILSSDNTIDDYLDIRRKLITYLQRYTDGNRPKWVSLISLVRESVPVDDRARFYAIAMEVIRIENNTIIVNDFNYRWIEGNVYLTYIGRKNDVEVTFNDINQIRSKLVVPATGELPDLRRMKFIRNSEQQDEVLYAWDWFYILEDGKYRKVKGYILTEHKDVDGSVIPSAGGMVTVKDPWGVETTLFITSYYLSKKMVAGDEIAPVGGIYQLNNYQYIQVIV